MPRLSFHSEFDGWFMLAVAVGTMFLVAVFYRRSYHSLPPRQWTRLFLLRMTAVSVVLLLLFRPVFSYHREIKQVKSIIFAVDGSSSMGIADDVNGATRWEQARSQVVKWCSELRSQYDLRIILFADSVRSLEDASELASVSPSGKATSLSRALLGARRSGGKRSVEAVVLVSDGIHNTAGDPVSVSRRLGMQVLTVGTGDPLHERSTKRDVRLADMDCPDQMAVFNKARITAFVEAVGMPGQVVVVELLEDGQVVAQKELALDDVQGSQEVVLEFVPTVEGLHTYMARIAEQSHEKITQNNVRSTSALVHEARIRVLYIEGTLRAEYGALVGRFLAKDPDVEFCSLIQTRPNVFVQRSNIQDLDLDGIPSQAEQLKQFDLFLIGDLDVSFLPEDTMRMIHDRVMDGAGLIMIGGYHSLGPGGYAGTLIETLLPVRLGGRDVGQATEPFQPRITPMGRHHPIFANIAEFFPSDSDLASATDLPALSGCVNVVGKKPGATVLLTHPDIERDGAPMVVMAVQAVGKGRTAVFSADTTRNWHQTLRALGQDTPFLRFWGQVVRWLAGRSEAVDTEAGIVATTDRAYYEPEAQVRIKATVRGDDGAAATAATVTATVKGPRGVQSQVELVADSGPAGHYEAVFEPPRSGRYVIDVAASAGDVQLTAEALRIDVGRPNLEFDDLELNEATLIAIAQETRGEYFHISLAERLTDRLKRTHRRQLVQYEVALAWPPLLWVIFVIALSIEWLLRRRYQLR